ncbi:CHAD domain-containing protein [candidate division KSB1 bacterium]|nr:CHAD domain-containing protein [candidate division KSB1 bacterium]
MGPPIEKTLPELIRILLLEQIDIARSMLLNKSLDFNDVIHDVRTSFKKIRAFILLLKTELGEDVYKNETRCFRAEGKGIAELRDSYVVLMTLELLAVKYPDQLRNNTVNAVQNKLTAGYEAKKNFVLEQDELTKQAGRLLTVKNRVTGWSLPENGGDLIFDRLKECYEKGRSQMTDAKTDKTDKRLHNWRKIVKHLWYQVRVFEPFNPEILIPFDESLHSLSDFLGEDHDLAVLNNIIPAPEDIENKNELNILRNCIYAERNKLQTGAFSLADSIYAESSGQFADRIAGYWRNGTIKPD